ncbi:MAG: hypothetical protein ABL926_13445 [Novosphingobium sp.]|uniref:hypothetical protein n=1 Tax=Novosphingobium sp. TaxID=1874826 RepID=UPI0032B79226
MARTRRIGLSAMLAAGLGSASTPGAAISQDRLIDLSIAAINPDLNEARPVIVCAIGGTAIHTCAANYATGKAVTQLNNTVDDINTIVRIYGYAKSGDFPKLVASLGVTGACMTFGELPGAGLACNEFGAKIAAATEYALKSTTAIVTPAGQAALQWIGKQAGAFGCAIGFSCPREKNPNVYEVDMGSHGTFAIAKFNLTGIWQHDYAPRIDEGIRARLQDPRKYKAMLTEVNISAPGMWLTKDVQLGWETINGLTGQLSIEERPIGIYPIAFAPFQRELNRRYSALVFDAAADQLDPSAYRYTLATRNWLDLVLTVEANKLFDKDLPELSMNASRKALVAKCRDAVEYPARALQHWGAGAALVGDTTVLRDRPAGYWGQIGNWCAATFEPAFAKEVNARRTALQLALAGGCTKRDDGARGLLCPAPKPGVVAALAGPLAQCRRAYKGNAAACLAAPAGPQVIQPVPNTTPPRIRPIQPLPSAPPSPSAEPSPSASPVPPIRIKPGLRVPG